MKTRYKHIHFLQMNKYHWVCLNNKSEAELGNIDYYKPWRKYVFEGEAGAIFDSSCLQDILHFMGQL